MTLGLGDIDDSHNIVGLSYLMKDDKNNPDINIEELEKSIINGEKDVQVEEEDHLNKYKLDIERLSRTYGVSLSNDESLAEDLLHGRAGAAGADATDWVNKQTSQYGGDGYAGDSRPNLQRDPSFRPPHGSSQTQGFERPSSPYARPLRESSFVRPQRESSFARPQRGSSPQSNENPYYSRETHEGIRMNDLGDYKFRAQYTPGADDGYPNIQDRYMRNMTQEQQKRSHVNQVFSNLNRNNRAPMDNYDLTADREYEDKQTLLSAIEALRDDLQLIGVDISRVQEVDMDSSMADIRKAYNKLIYKNNDCNYSNFADELFIMGAQLAEWAFDGEKEWMFGHKPDLTGWSNTVRGKLRRMRFTKTQIVRKIVDDYQIPPWLQIAIEIVPSAFTHSRHRRAAVRDNVANNATYQDAIHNLNNAMNEA